MKAISTLALLLACASASGQTIVNVSAVESTASPGKPVTLSVQLAGTDRKPWCGLALSFGDGKGLDHRVESLDQPLTFPHAYDAPGVYQVKVEGRNLTRGLKSATACEGSKTVAVRVEDPEQQRRAQEAADAQRKAREAEAQRQELETRERELRAREAELKERELRAREAALKAREADLQRRAAAASPAARPAPAAAPAKKDDTLDVFK